MNRECELFIDSANVCVKHMIYAPADAGVGHSNSVKVQGRRSPARPFSLTSADVLERSNRTVCKTVEVNPPRGFKSLRQLNNLVFELLWVVGVTHTKEFEW